MANVIQDVFVDAFDRNIRQLAQQSRNRLRGYVDVRGSSSETEAWDTLAPSEMSLKSGRGAATPVVDAPWGRRVAGNATYDIGELVGTDDITQMLADPLSNLTRSFGMAAYRSQDDVIIAALDGNGGSVAFDAGQIVGGAYTADINFDLVTEVSEKFLDNDIDPETEKVFVISPAQQRKLLQLTEATNQDYAHKALQQGFVQDWMGFMWIVSTRLNSPGANQRDCFAMTKQALGFQLNQDLTTNVAKDPSASFDWRVYTEWQGGCVRVEDEQIVWAKVSE
jgi:hypothetical protein